MISAETGQFLRERLSSVEQIEIILLLRADAARAWTAPEVAAQLGTAPESTAMRLFLLASNGFLRFEGAGVPRYRYGALDAETDARIGEIADVFRERPQEISGILGSTSSDPVRTFADAFKLKK